MPRPPKPTKEGDAFLANVRQWDAVLLMAEGPYRTRFLGMRRPMRINLRYL